MGVHQLSKVIGDHAPKAVKNLEMKSFFGTRHFDGYTIGRKVAIDASMSIYQFLIAVRQEGNALMNAAGETTSHIMGMFYRTIRMVDNGIKPVYVFEGKPPTMKAGELAKRSERREESSRELAKAEAEEDQEAIEKFSKRLVKITSQHNEDCKTLLRLMGIPFVTAPGEAEAQCAALAKAGKVYAVGTEDMDALAFGTPVLLRHLTFSEARKLPIQEFSLSSTLAGLDFTMGQFIDLCILLGCDYIDTIRGIGPKKAVDMIQKQKSIENLLKTLDSTKYPIPDNWPFEEARRLFTHPDVADPEDIELKWNEPDEEGLVQFMCHKHGFNCFWHPSVSKDDGVFYSNQGVGLDKYFGDFMVLGHQDARLDFADVLQRNGRTTTLDISEERIRTAAKKLVKAKNTSTQGRIDNFFTALPQARQPESTVQKLKNGASTAGKRRSGTGSTSTCKKRK